MIQPLLDRVLLEKKEAEKTTASGIILSESSSEKPSSAIVVAVGPGKLDDNGKLVEVGVQVGDTVIFKQYSTTEIKDNGKDYLIVDSKDILAVVK